MWQSLCTKCDYLSAVIRSDAWEKCARGMAIYAVPTFAFLGSLRQRP